MKSDIAEAGGAEHGVDHRVAEHVGVGVPQRPAIGGNGHAAEHQPAPFDEPMQIVAGANPHQRLVADRAAVSVAAIASASGTSSGVVILMFDASPWTRRT